MTKISVYNIDEYVTADDKWIGTDVNTYNKTKNFTPRKLSHYFNNNQVINTGVDLLYKYFTITPPDTRPTGTLSFETEIGQTVNFSAISTFLLSKTTLKGNDVVEFLNFLVGTKVLLYKAKNINLFGNYKIVSVEEYIPEPNFLVVNVDFIEGNGFIEEDEDYMISLIDISSGGGGSQNLQEVTNLGSTTTKPITANSFIKSGGTGTNILLDNGLTVALSSIGGNTNLSSSQTASNFTINSDTGTDATIPLGNGTLAGATLNDYTTAEKTKLSGIAPGANVGVVPNSPITGATKTKITYDSKGLVTAGVDATTADITDSTNKRYVTDANLTVLGNTSGTNTGDQNLQSVTNLGASTDNKILITVLNDDALNASSETGIAVYGYSNNNIGIFGESSNGVAVYGYSNNGIGGEFISNNNEKGIRVTANDDTVAEFNQSLSNKGLIINSGTSSTGNFIELAKNSVNKLVVNQAGELTATKLIKEGGTLSQILAADGSVITAGTNITITGGQISSVGGTGGGGSSVNYYLNGGTSQGTFGGSTYYEFSTTAVIGTGADFSRGTNGYIASFITDVADPSLLLIPGGNWNLEFFFSSSSAGGSPSFYTELYKYDGTTFTLIASSSATPEGITGGTAIDAYFTPLAVPETVLTVNDRLAIRVFVNASSKTITLHTQNGHLCEVITTFTAGLTTLNGLQAQVQNFATGTTGTDFAINSSGSTHTFNLPSASATARGVVTTSSQTFAGDKTFTGTIGASNLSGSNTGDNATNTQYSGLAASKQDTLQNTVNIKSINGNSLLGSGDLTISGTGISSLNGLTGATQTFSATTNTSTGIPAWSSSGTNHQLNIPVAGGATVTGLITGTSQFISGTKTFQSNPEIPVPAGNSGPCIVLGSTGGGGTTGTLSIGDTVTYPNGQEMQRVKGVTSPIQTQLDGKQPTLTAGNGINITTNTISTVDTSRAAYTMLANNTNASAIPTTQVFKDVGEQSYAGATPTWTGTTAPSGTTNHSYQWLQIGKVVNLRVNLDYATAGTSLTAVTFDLPSDCPIPKLPLGVSANGDVIAYGNGMLVGLRTTPTTPTTVTCALRIKGTGTYEINILRLTALGHKYAYANIQYFAQ